MIRFAQRSLLVAALLVSACNATPLPTPPSASPERIEVFDENGNRVVVRGQPGAVAGAVAALRITSPAGRTEGEVASDGSFTFAVPGARSDQFFVEALLPLEDVFLLSFVGGPASVAQQVDPGPDADGDGSPDAIDCDPMNSMVAGRRCPATCDEERCDGRDTDCDGTIDEGCSGEPCMTDADCVLGSACTMGICAPTACMSNADCPAGTVCESTSASCLPRGDDSDGDGYPMPIDCDDSDPTVNPAAAELCDMIDQNCDGMIDEACGGTMCAVDSDCPAGTACQMGECTFSSCMDDADCPMGSTCNAGACATPRRDDDGDGYSPPADCNDSAPSVHPGAPELCNMVDDDCDGTLDEGCEMMGSCMSDSECPTGFVCESAVCRRLSCMSTMDCPAGLACIAGECQATMGVDGDMDMFSPPEDCNDMDPGINPGITESCNMIDDNCDGTIDEGC